MSAHAKPIASPRSPSPIATQRSAAGIPTQRLAVWWLLASESVIFGGLIGSYLLHRLGHPEWADAAAVTNTALGATNTFVLLTSSFTAVLAHQAAEQGNGRKAGKLLFVTLLGALGFLGIKSYEWWYEISHGYTISSHTFWSFYYAMGGLHALHVIVGGIVMAVVAFDAYRGRNLQRVEPIGIYWHFVDVIWIFLFPLLYIAK